jgi:hypothetical protein
MNRVLILGSLVLAACASALSGPKDISVTTVALRASPGASAESVAAAIGGAGARAALVAAPRSEDWFQAVATATDLTLSGPAEVGDLGLAFLAPEPVGDTTIALPYGDTELVIRDALYEIEEDRLLDLIAFRVSDETVVRDAIRRLMEYVATDVNNAAALVMAVAVPNSAAADSVARMLSPGYYDAARCEVGQDATTGPGIRLFYGPDARVYCTNAALEERPEGAWVRADLIMGRR